MTSTAHRLSLRFLTYWNIEFIGHNGLRSNEGSVVYDHELRGHEIGHDGIFTVKLCIELKFLISYVFHIHEILKTINTANFSTNGLKAKGVLGYAIVKSEIIS